MASSKTTKKNYGAVETKTDDEEEVDPENFDSFNPDEEAYIHNSNSPLTLRRLAEIATPILAAVLILGGAIFLVWKTSGHWHYSNRDSSNGSWSTSGTSNKNRPPLTPHSDTPYLPGPPHTYEHGNNRHLRPATSNA